ncbi:MarR family transcriptional regulator [Actinomycetospora atypica]|uniref:MarR family transcriptional regulator n=1 Tax=Actinomycetospora atypica TaxID=1290095 RepID=A0ABV9YH52_9PSEU
MDPEDRIARLDETTLAVRDLIGASRDLATRMAKVMAINATDMTAIHLLTEQGPMGAAQLAERLGIRSASATVLVDRLEQAGHVERVRDTTDRRRVTLTATAAARRASLEAWLPAILDLDEVCRTLSDDEAALARDLLRRLTATMEGAARG